MHPRRTILRKAALLLVFGLSACGVLAAQLAMPAIFGDHMVLQQQRRLPVWGSAFPGEKVTIAFDGQRVATTAGPDGRWRVDLRPVAQSGIGRKLTVTAPAKTLSFDDVLVGDVWLASGQSNMAYKIDKDSRGAETIANSADPQLRFFIVPIADALTPQTGIAVPPPTALEGAWHVCRPDTLGNPQRWHDSFSAVAYYFAHNIRLATGHPVGIIGSYAGQTFAGAWTSMEGLALDPALAHYLAEHAKLVAQVEAMRSTQSAREARFAREQAAYEAASGQYAAQHGQSFDDAVSDWDLAANRALVNRTLIPPEPALGAAKARPVIASTGGKNGPANSWNAMIAPLVPFALQGVIWYQGETDSRTPQSSLEYATLFPRLIQDWRAHWQRPELPFLFIQLAAFIDPPDSTGESVAWLRESQRRALALPNTGMATAVDLGDPFNVHPKDKVDVGKRLSLVGLRVAYHRDIVSSGPLFQSIEVANGKAHLAFTSVGGGLTVATPPWTASGLPAPRSTQLTGFTIAGADRRFFPASATIEGALLTVSSPQVPSPVAVRYMWANNPAGNLYNRELLPASPFRTDNWPPPIPPARPH